MNGLGWLLVLLVLALALIGMTRWDLWGVLWRDLLRLGTPTAGTAQAPEPHEAPPAGAPPQDPEGHVLTSSPHKPAFHRSGRRASS